MTIAQKAYPAAHLAAPRLYEHFAHHLDRNASTAPVPDVAAIEALIDTAFWASLRRQEGYVPKISLAFLPPERSRQPLLLERPLPLREGALARVAPAVEREGIHLGVWRDREGELLVWGTLRDIPKFCFVLEVASPGLLVVKHHRGDELAKFVNVAVLEGDQIKVIDPRASRLPDCPALLSVLLGFDSPSTMPGSVNVLVELAVSMRAHGRGGLLLVVPGGREGWRESIVQPVPYGVSPPFSELSDLMEDLPEGEGRRVWHELLERAVATIAGLTAVDGATVITDRYDLLAFGAKIARRRGWPPVERVTLTEPIEGGEAATMPPSEVGGTRHLAAAQFVQDQRDAVALVASQDGRFTVFAWSECEEIVHAHRVEVLLL
jgi:hypothetical protein